MKILVGIDGGPQQAAAVKLASRPAEGGELTVVVVSRSAPDAADSSALTAAG